MLEAAFSEQLLQWWDKHGRKDLPWQHPRDAYRVWVSEIMLQQTQVKTVIPYFNRFMERFPDIPSLASASTDEVLGYWSGLGYYARARNLLKTARICLNEHAGDLPGTAEALTALPGIGESTANAIYSQAYNKPAVILDGNVKRVLARYFAVEGWPGKSSVHKLLWTKAAQLLPKTRGADYTQAVMDLGATLCTRTKPLCEQCPVQMNCKAFETNTVDLFPGKRPRLKIAQKTLYMLILMNADGDVLLERRPPAGIWGGLWCLPSADDSEPLKRYVGQSMEKMETLPVFQHQLTHIHMSIHPLMGLTEPASSGVECAPDQQWFTQLEWSSLGLPKPVRHLLETYSGNGQRPE